MINYSIIIPHKNTPELLDRMLKSIPVRDDLEIIIVDDNSSPDKVDFDAFPGHDRKHTRHIFLKESSGAGNARNEGLRLAKGEWVFFADADDYFTPEFSKLLDKYASRRDIDMVFVNAAGVNEAGEDMPLSLNRYISNFTARKKDALQVLRYGFWAPWSRLIRKSVLTDNNVEFENVKTGNDMMGIVKASAASRTFEVFPDVVYMYYKPSGGSQTWKMYDDEAYLQRMRQRFELNNIYRENGFPYEWPIMKLFNNKRLNASPEGRAIMRRYNYSKGADLIRLARYAWAKLNKII